MNKRYQKQNEKKTTTGSRYLQLDKRSVAIVYKEFLQIKRQKADNPKEGKKWIKNMNEQFSIREKPKE